MALDSKIGKRKTWLMRGRVGMTRLWTSEDAAQLIPLKPDGRAYGFAFEWPRDLAPGERRYPGLARLQAGWELSGGISPPTGEKATRREMCGQLASRRRVANAGFTIEYGE